MLHFHIIPVTINKCELFSSPSYHTAYTLKQGALTGASRHSELKKKTIYMQLTISGTEGQTDRLI